jgi:hypothetical protein
MSVFGGAEENLVDKYKMYKLSAEADAKRQMVKKLCEVFKGLKFDVPDFPTSDDPVELEQCADQLKEVVAKRLKRGLKEDEASREKVCRLLAREINNIFGGKLIDDSLGVDSVCASVTEFCLSFARGLHLEYFTVQADVKKSITNCKLLLEMMEKLSVKVKTYISDAKDPELNAKYLSLDRIYTRAAEEMKKQIEILSNLMNVKTVDDPLVLAFKEHSDLRSIVERLGVRTDDFKTGKYADNIVQILLGLTTVAEAASRVNSALKQVGMSAEEYSNLTTMNELKEKLRDLGLKRTDKFDIFAKSEEVLKKNFDPDSEDWKALKEKIGGARIGDEEEFDEYGQENYDKQNNKKTPIAKQLDKLSAERKAIVKLFAKSINEQYTQLTKELQSIVSKLGTEIQINEQTNHIRTVLKYLASNYSDDSRIELSLLGVYSDVKTREIREQFISTLNQIISACSGVSHFEGVSKACEDLLKTIEHFYDSSRAKFGGDEGTEVIEGGAGENYVDELPKMARSNSSLKKSINEFVYFYYLAKVKKNFKQTGTEIENASSEYIKLLGAAVANRIATAKSDFSIRNKLVLQTSFTQNGNNTQGIPVVPILSEYAGTVTEFNKYTEIYNRRVLVLENFYSALQAVDLYLKEFTTEIANNPEKVLELKSMIEETEMINNWFNEQTGDSIVDFFTFPIVNGFVLGNDKFNKIDTDEHYYDTVYRQNLHIESNLTVQPVDNVTISTTGFPADDTMTKHVNKIFDNYSGFKNFINIFAKIGDLGNRKVFLSPAQIYKFITDFIKEASVDYGKIDASGKYLFGAMPSQIVSYANETVSTSFKYEREYLAKMLKAMTAKIFATIGLYNVYKTITPVTTVNQTRIILGGDGEVEPIIEAAELYFRIPRLIEYYRNILQYKRDDTAQKKIALIPDISSMYGPLIKFIFKFEDPTYVYSDGELRNIVREINAIYLKKSSDCDTIVMEIVKEMNSRFGVVKLEDKNKYYAEIDEFRQTTDAPGHSQTDYELFDGEDVKAYNKPPSSFFTTGDANTRVLNDDRTLLNDNGYNFVNEFRDEIDKSFQGLQPDTLELNYDLIIKETVAKMKLADSNDDKIRLVYNLIQNTSASKVSGIKVQLFQETVVIGLESLHNIKLILDNFVHSVYRLEIVRRMQEEIVRSAGDADIIRIADATTGMVGSTANLMTVNANLINNVPNNEHINALLQSPKLTEDNLGDTGVNNRLYTTHFYCQQYAISPGNDAMVIMINNVTAAVQQPVALTIPNNGPNQNDGPNALVSVNNITNILSEDHTLPDVSDASKYRVLLAFATNYDRAMRDFLETTFNFINSSNGLVTLTYNADKSILFNYSKLRELIDNILTSVKKYIDMFKPYIPSAIINKYIKSSEEYSLYYLEEKLVFNRFDNDKSTNMYHIDQAIKAYNKVYKWLLMDKPNMTIGRTGAGIAPAVGYVRCNLDAVEITKYPYGNVFAEIIYKINTLNNDRILINKDNIMHNIISSNADGTPNYPNIANVNFSTDFMNLSTYSRANYISTNVNEENLSILQTFNQILERYISTCSELTPTPKIYSNLILPLCTGPLNKVILNPTIGLPDVFVLPLNVYANREHSRFRGGPGGGFILSNSNVDQMNTLLNNYNGPKNEESILLYSLAKILQTFTKKVLKNTSIPAHIVSSLTDVNSHIKDMLKCNLPYFIKIFDLFVSKCDFLIKFIEKNDLNLTSVEYSTAPSYTNITNLQATVAALRDSNATRTPNNQNNALFTSDINNSIRSFSLDVNGNPAAAGVPYNNKMYILKILRKISESAFILSDSATTVLKELGDLPIYGQIGDNSIELFERRYGKMPITPYSGVFSIIDNIDTWFASSGNSTFKQNYSIRAIFNNLTLASLPYTKLQLAEYNDVARSDEKITDYETFIQNINQAVVYYFETRMKGNINNIRPYSIMIRDANNIGILSADNIAIDHPNINNNNTSYAANGWRYIQESHYAISLITKIMYKRYDVISKDQGEQSPQIGQKYYGTKNMLYYEDIISDVTEKSDRDDYENKLILFYVNANVPVDRKKECIQNIIDMNIVPFNIHMLMRDIPLINIYNYDYSFNKFVDEFLQTRNYTTNFNDLNIKKLFAMLLQNPYANLSQTNIVNNDDKFNLLRGIFIGDDSLGMGRPKFLSDQLFNKCLLQSVYNNRANQNEEMRAINTTNHSYTDETSRQMARRIISLISNIDDFCGFINYPQKQPSTEFLASIPFAPPNDTVADAHDAYLEFHNDYSASTGQHMLDIMGILWNDVRTRFLLMIGGGGGGNQQRNVAYVTRLLAVMVIGRGLNHLGVAGHADHWGTDTAFPNTCEATVIFEKLNMIVTKLRNMSAVSALANQNDFQTYCRDIITTEELIYMTDVLKNGGLLDKSLMIQNVLRVEQLIIPAPRAATFGGAFYRALTDADAPIIGKLGRTNANLIAGLVVGGLAAGANQPTIYTAMDNIDTIVKNSSIIKKYYQSEFSFYHNSNNAGAFDASAANGLNNSLAVFQNYMTRVVEIIHTAAVPNVPAVRADLLLLPDGFMNRLSGNTLKNSTYSLRHKYKRNGISNDLSYVKEGQVIYKNFSEDQMNMFDDTYKYRFNSYLVRDLFFITNINRLLRQVFEKELTGSREVVKHGYELANAGLTEYGQYPMKPNEISTSAQGNGLKRLIRDADSAEFYSS